MATPLAKEFVREKCHLLLSIQRPEVPDRIRERAQQLGLVEKGETHISVAVSANARQVADAVSRSADPQSLLDEIERLFKDLAWEYDLIDEYVLQERSYSEMELTEHGHSPGTPAHTRRTIVEKVELPDLSLFYARLSQLLGVALPTPAPHVTLFSWSDHPSFMTRGIGISSEEEFSRFSLEAL